jgi:hypothetical protein
MKWAARIAEAGVKVTVSQTCFIVQVIIHVIGVNPFVGTEAVTVVEKVLPI